MKVNVHSTVCHSFSLLSPGFPVSQKFRFNEPALNVWSQIYHHCKGLCNKTNFSGVQCSRTADVHNETQWASNTYRITDRLNWLGFVLIRVLQRQNQYDKDLQRGGFNLRTHLWGYETQQIQNLQGELAASVEVWKTAAGRIPSSLEDDSFCSRKVFNWLDEARLIHIKEDSHSVKVL